MCNMKEKKCKDRPGIISVRRLMKRDICKYKDTYRTVVLKV